MIGVANGILNVLRISDMEGEVVCFPIGAPTAVIRGAEVVPVSESLV